MGILHDMECTLWKSNPLFWQAVAAIKAARVTGAIATERDCKNAVAAGNAIFSGLSGMISSCGDCACEHVFNQSSNPSAVSLTGIHVFVRGGDGSLSQRFFINGWSGWITPEGIVNSGIGVATPASGYPHIFALDKKAQLIHSWWDGAQWVANWQNLGAPPVGLTLDAPAVTATSGPRSQLHVFLRGLDNSVWQIFFTTAGGWSSWVKIPADVNSGIGVATPASGYPHIFALDKKAQLIHSWWDGAQWVANWQNLGAPPVGLTLDAPGVTTTSGPGQLHVFLRGLDNSVWQIFFTTAGGWSSWVKIPADVNSGIGAATPASGNPHIFALDKKAQLIHSWWDGAQWVANWQNLGAPPVGIASGPGVTVT